MLKNISTVVDKIIYENKKMILIKILQLTKFNCNPLQITADGIIQSWRMQQYFNVVVFIMILNAVIVSEEMNLRFINIKTTEL